MAVNVILIIIAIVVTVVVVVGNCYFLVYFQHEEDKNTAWFPKIMVVSGLTVAYLSILMLPMDVSNVSTIGGLDMVNLWQGVYMIVAAYTIVVVPFTIFYYEALDDRFQVMTAIGYTFVTAVVAVLISVLMWLFIGQAELPVTDLISGLVIDDGTDGLANPTACPAPCLSNSTTLEISVSYVIYLICCLSFVGFFLFVTFGGIGLVALPMDLINSYRFRPKRIELDAYARKKMELRERAKTLMESGKQLKAQMDGVSSRNRKMQREFNKFKQSVYFLEEDFEQLQLAYKERGGNPIKYWAFLAFGILATSTSLLWWLHMVIYMAPKKPIHPFLNDFLIRLDESFGLLATITYGVFSFYLLWCIIKGQIKFGLRFVFFTLHPLKLGATMMNSLVFNTGIVLLCSITITQFSTIAFAEYARLTAIDSIFGAQARYLKFFTYFFENFVYVIISVAGVSLIYFALHPRDERKKYQALFV